jgi:ABC-2 type transport system permease protein
MAGFAMLFRKEIRSAWKTHRVLIVLAVFLVLGLGTPLLLKYMDALLPGGDSGIILPDFTAADAVQGYLNSVGQIGLIVAILVAMGAVARERESGTAAMTLSKPVGSGAFIVSKLAALVLVLGAGIVVGAVGCYLYTGVLFGHLDGGRFLLATLVAALYLVFCLAVTLMYSCLFKSQVAAGGLALLTLVVLAATAGLPGMKEYSPGALASWSERLVTGGGLDPWGALAVGVGLVLATTIAGWQAFKRMEL